MFMDIGPSSGGWVASHFCRKLIILPPETSRLGVGLHKPFQNLYWDFGRLELEQVFKSTHAMSS